MSSFNTIETALHWVESALMDSDLFYGHGTDNAHDEAVQLVMHVCNLPAEGDRRQLQMQLTAEQINAIKDLTKTRIESRKPLPYLTGKAYLNQYEFYVDERVIIPRSPIAELIAQHFSPWVEGAQVQTICDMCTGSACLAILSALELPQAQVDAVDLSSDALAVAQKNIDRFDLSSRVRLIQSDLFSQLSGQTYDIIISNPPYVDAADMADLPEEFRFEPGLALVGGDDGLDLVHKLLQQAALHLNDNGIIIIEVGNSWPAFERAYPQLPVTWLEFERGGEGVFLIQKSDLDLLVK